MEVTTVSPSPTSPTEGDNLCDIDVTDVAIDSVTLLICLCGLVGNGAVLCLLSLKAHNRVILQLVFADFLFLTVFAALLFLVEDVSCSPIMPPLYLSFLSRLSMVSYNWALFELMGTSSVADLNKLCILYMRCCRCNIAEHPMWLLFSFQFWAFFALLTVIPSVTYLCPSLAQEQYWAALISMSAIILLLFVAPMVNSSTINFIKAKWGSKKQQPKRRNISVFLIFLFILLLSLCNFLQQLGYTIVFSQVFFLLNCIHSSIKPFIYFLAGGFHGPCSLRSLWLSLQRVFDEQKEETAISNDGPMDTGV